MEENTLNIGLSLGSGESVSNLKKTVYEEELKEINEKKPLKEGSIDIQGTYFVEDEGFLEVGLFIRNGSKLDMSIEKVPIVIKDEAGEEFLYQIFNLKDIGVIPSGTGRPVDVKFDLPAGAKYDASKNYTLSLDSGRKMKMFSSVDTKVNNLPDSMPFELEKDARDFERALPTLRTNEFSISLYKLGYNRNREITCMLLIRNGRFSGATLKVLPVSIFDENDELIARNVFTNEEGIIKVDPEGSKLLTLTFPPESVFGGIRELDKCRVEFK
ncbi:MAG: SLAP domain-containing protein [Clostridiaceae bacterium]